MSHESDDLPPDESQLAPEAPPAHDRPWLPILLGALATLLAVSLLLGAAALKSGAG